MNLPKTWYINQIMKKTKFVSYKELKDYGEQKNMKKIFVVNKSVRN